MTLEELERRRDALEAAIHFAMAGIRNDPTLDQCKYNGTLNKLRAKRADVMLLIDYIQNFGSLKSLENRIRVAKGEPGAPIVLNYMFQKSDINYLSNILEAKQRIEAKYEA